MGRLTREEKSAQSPANYLTAVGVLSTKLSALASLLNSDTSSTNHL